MPGPRLDPSELDELDISKRQFLKAVAASGVASATAGCTGGGGPGEQSDGDSPSNNNSTTQSEPQQGGSLTMGLRGEPRNFSYWQSYTYYENNVTTHIWDALFEYSKEAPYQLEPALATDMTIEDNTTFVFDLREGVRFHDGSELTAEDVKASIEFVQNPDANASLAWMFTNVDSVNVVDDYTVEWTLSKPDAIAKFVPATLACGVAPKSQIEEKGIDLGTDPVGAGPYQLDEYKSGNFVRLSRHDDYWADDAPYLDTITFQIEPSSSSRVTGLTNGSLDTIDGFPSTQANTIKNTSGINLYETTSYGAAFFTFNQTKEPFGNVNVRRALSYAIDTEELTAASKGEYGEHAYSMIPEEMEFGYVGPDDLEYSGFPYDPEQAKEMLDAEGLTGDPRFETELHVPNSADSQQAAKIIQSQLSDIGVTAEITKLTEKQWFQEWFGSPVEEQAPMLFGEWLTDFPDPQPLLEPLYRTGTTNNWTGYSNDEVDSLLDTVRNSLNTEERAEAAFEANKTVVDDAVYLWMWHSVSMRALASQYQGYTHRPPFFQYWTTIFRDTHDTEL